MSEPVRMKCGHVANSRHDGEPSCVICFGIFPGAVEVDDNPPSLEGRLMRCSDCWKSKPPVPSNPDGAFFEYRGDYDFDSYYCGCRGWD